MTVINPKSISGITSITLPSGDDNVLTIHTNDGTERFRVDSSGNVKVGSAATISPDGDVFFTGVTTATTFTGAHSGSGANLTSLPSAQLSGALPAISAANLTNVPAANVVGVHTSMTVTNATTTGTAVVGGGVTISESGIEASGIGITCANINGTQIGGRRNIIINGAMQVAQRGTSSTSKGYHTVDRFYVESYDVDENPTQAQVDVSSGTTPYTNGFRKALKITNGNQTSGAGSQDVMVIFYTLEAQDIANSGWSYTSPSSFITLSFWIKSSVAQNFYGRLYSYDGTSQGYAFETGSLSADTWTKVTKTIPGNSNLTFDNNENAGLMIEISAFRGTGNTGSMSLNQWGTYNSNTRTPDQTSTWYTTNDATLEVTGLQLEVGSQATPFEHRSFGEELKLCQRYYYKSTQYSYPIQNAIETGQQTDGDGFLGWVFYNSTSCRSINYDHPVEMRASPTVNFYSSARVSSPTDGKMALYSQVAWVNLSSNTANPNTRRLGIKGTSATNFSAGQVYLIGGGFECGAEL